MLVSIDRKWSGLNKDIIINKGSSETDVCWRFNSKYFNLNHLLAMEKMENLKPISVEFCDLLEALNIDASEVDDYENLIGSKNYSDRAAMIKSMLTELFSTINLGYVEILEKRYMLTKRIVSAYYDGSSYEPPVYDHASSLTGRTKIVSGKNFLIMKKDDRRNLQSTFHNGKILEIDIVSLEPRVLCKIMRDEHYQDIYDHVSKNILKKNVDRKAVKLGVISALYGAGKKTIKSMSGLTSEDINKLKSWFMLDDLRKSLVNEYEKNENFKSFYGRNIYAISSPINYFVQSTAADCACLAFYDFLKNYDNSQIKLLGVVHDAIIIDCNPNVLNEIKQVNYIHEDILDIKLPVKVKEIE